VKTIIKNFLLLALIGAFMATEKLSSQRIPSQSEEDIQEKLDNLAGKSGGLFTKQNGLGVAFTCSKFEDLNPYVITTKDSSNINGSFFEGDTINLAVYYHLQFPPRQFPLFTISVDVYKEETRISNHLERIQNRKTSVFDNQFDRRYYPKLLLVNLSGEEKNLSPGIYSVIIKLSIARQSVGGRIKNPEMKFNLPTKIELNFEVK